MTRRLQQLRVQRAQVKSSSVVLAFGPRFAGSNPADGYEVLTAIKILSTPSFGEEVKPEDPYRNILRHVKNHCGVWQRYYVG
jgi:hypothetical protein